MASVVHHVAHGLVAGDPFYFGNIIPTDAGPVEGQLYYVLAAGLTANDFQFSETPAGTAFVLTYDITSGIISEPAVYTPVTDPADVMAPPVPPPTPSAPTVTSAQVTDTTGGILVHLKVTL